MKRMSIKKWVQVSTPRQAKCNLPALWAGGEEMSGLKISVDIRDAWKPYIFGCWLCLLDEDEIEPDDPNYRRLEIREELFQVVRNQTGLLLVGRDELVFFNNRASKSATITDVGIARTQFEPAVWKWPLER